MDRTTITVDHDRCQHDGLCARVCPMRIFSSPDGEPPRVAGAEHCVLCGQCIAVCPNQAVAHSALDRDRFDAVGAMPEADAAAVASLLRQRRSVRTYAARPVPREELAELVGIAGFSPTGAHGGEGWTRTCVVVSGADEMRRVLEITAAYMERLARLLDGPVVRTAARWTPAARVGRSLLPDIAMRLERHAQGEDVITYGAPHAVFFHASRHSVEPQVTCDTAMYTVMLLAHARGIGTCWNGWLVKAANGFKVARFTALRELLGIPEHHDVFAAATLGYRGVRLHSTPDRRTEVRFVGTP